MSEANTPIQFPRIYSNSLERSKVTTNINGTQQQKEKRYFKFFVINNKITPKPTGTTKPIYWGIKDVNVLDRDIETYLDRPITFTPTGLHPDPARAGIYETNYKNRLDFVKDAVKYYSNFAKGKIINIYKPNPSLLQAAINDPSVTVNYEGMGETTDPDFIAMLDENEKNDKQIFVSPGVIATDSKVDTDGNIIVNGFVGTHLAVVDEPAHTKPIAYVKKETCNVDGKTCYFKLLTASEMSNLNNDVDNSINMATEQQQGTNQSVPNGLDIAGKVDDQQIPQVGIDTTISDAKGNEIGKVTANKTGEGNEPSKQEKNKENANTEENTNGKTKTKEKPSNENKPKESKEDNERVTISKTDLQALLNDYKTEILSEVENRQSQKIEAATKLQLVNSFITNSEETQPDYEFYNSLPVSSEQLKKILEDSKFNNNKDNKKKVNVLAASAHNGNSYGNEAKSRTLTASTANNSSDIHHLFSGEAIPERYR